MTTGIVTTVAGNGQRGVPADGSDAANSPLVDPPAAIDRRGNVYILERGGNRCELSTTAARSARWSAKV